MRRCGSSPGVCPPDTGAPRARCGNRRSSPARGFTLLEVIVAVGLVLLLVGGIYAFFGHTLGVRETLHRQADTTLAQRRVLDMMAEDLQSAIAYSTLQMTLDGAAEQFSFARTVVPSRAVFLSAKPTSLGAPGADDPADTAFQPQHDVQLVSYVLSRYVDDEGVEQVGGVMRSCQKTVLATTAEEGADIETVVLSRHVKFLHVEYWDGVGWVESWNAPTLPPAVRIALGTEPLEEGEAYEEYPHQTMWRTILIPAGVAEEPSGRDGVAEEPSGRAGGGGRRR